METLLENAQNSKYSGLVKIISGGQTGADQGGLIAAHLAGVLTGGTAPSKYITSIGPNLLLECLGLDNSGSFASRTELNVKNSDGTLIFVCDENSSGTKCAIKALVKHNKPYLVYHILDFCDQYGDNGKIEVPQQSLNKLFDFVVNHKITCLNVAGNREQYQDQRITRVTQLLVSKLIRLLKIENLIYNH